MGRDRLYTLGDNPDQRLDSVETILQRMSRRLTKTVTVLTPTVPQTLVILELPEDGILLRTFFPVDSYIGKIFLHAERVDKDTVPNLVLDLSYTTGNRQYIFPIKKGPSIIVEDLYISAGSRATVSVDLPINVGGLWIAWGIEIMLNPGTKEQFIIDDLLTEYDAREEKDEPKPEKTPE